MGRLSGVDLRGMASAAGMLSFGTVLAQGLGLVNIVLATRIYSQEDFGTYSVFLAFAAIVASVNLLAYDKAIPNVDNDERNEFVLGMLIVLMAFTVLSGLIYSIAHYSFAIALAAHGSAVGVIKVSEMTNVRDRALWKMFFARIGPSVGFSLILVVNSLINGDQLEHLVYGQVVATGAFAVLYFAMSNASTFRVAPNPGAAVSLLKRERNFALFVAPSEVMNRLAYHLPVIIIGRYFDVVAAAQYHVVLRFGFAPVNIVASAFGKVLHGHIAEDVRNRSSRGTDTYKTAKLLLLVMSLLTAIGGLAVLPIVIEFLLGPDWQTSAHFSRILSPLFAAMVFVSPLAVSLYVFEKHRLLLLNQASYLLIACFSFALAVVVKDLVVGVWLFSILSTIRYAVMYFYIDNEFRSAHRQSVADTALSKGPASS